MRGSTSHFQRFAMRRLPPARSRPALGPGPILPLPKRLSILPERPIPFWSEGGRTAPTPMPPNPPLTPAHHPFGSDVLTPDNKAQLSFGLEPACCVCDKTKFLRPPEGTLPSNFPFLRKSILVSSRHTSPLVQFQRTCSHRDRTPCWPEFALHIAACRVGNCRVPVFAIPIHRRGLHSSNHGAGSLNGQVGFQCRN